MNSSYGYIYIRNHLSYKSFNACKLGKAQNIPERDSVYATSEIIRGYFELVFEFDIKIINEVERLLQNEFYKFNIKYDGGTEFYNEKIIKLIEPCIIKYGFKYKKLSKEEINNLLRLNRITNNIKKNIILNNNIYNPRDEQIIIIDNTVEYFKKNDKGILVLTCGIGKTLISLWITQKLNYKSIIIGVPNLILLNQWKKYIIYLFNNIPILIVSETITTETIKNFIKKNSNNCIVLTTYSSSYKVYNVSYDMNIMFDMKINDETHHLTSNNFNKEGKTYVNMLKIKSKKQLSLTATLKILENNEYLRDDEIIISNDNKEYFGDIIDKRSLLWAINKNIICDYNIITITTNDEQIEEHLLKFQIVEENDKRLFLSAFVSLKSISDGFSHHLLIYSNDHKNSLKIINYIKMLLNNNYFNIPDLFYSDYDSYKNIKEQENIIKKFENSKYGILGCVYCLGEGWDLPLLDSVVFAENMISSIRILQSALRPCRKDKINTDKISKIILPILNKDDWLDNNNSDFKKVRKVIYQMGLEDETISQKIKVFKINIEKQKPKIINKNEKLISELGEYDYELTNKLKLKTIKRIALNITYEKAKKIIVEKNIKTKKSYYELCEIDNRLSNEPEIIFKGQFTNWIDYLSIKRVYYDLETCKNKVSEYLTLYPEIKKTYLNLSTIIKQLCKLDKLFPPDDLWNDYYNIKDLTELIINNNNKKKSGVI